MLKIYKHRYHLRYETAPKGFQGPFFMGVLGLYLKKYLPQKDYDHIFNTPTDNKIMKRYPEAPKGFVIDIPYIPAQEMELNLILLGKNNNYSDAFSKAVRDLGAYNKIDIYYIGEEIVSPDKKRFTQSDHFSIKYETPVHIQYKGRIWERPEFHIIMRNTLRRVFLIGYYHYDVTLPIDFNRLIKQSEGIILKDYKWECQKITRVSSRKKGVMNIEGYIGISNYKIMSEICMDELLMYLGIVENIHVGKNTVFGSGKITVNQ